MAGQDQPKTKAELLRELQSIQSLLDEQQPDELVALDDDEDIPILEEFFEEEEAEIESSEPLAADDETLDALNAAYAALTGDIEAAGASTQDTDHEKDTEPAPKPAPQSQPAQQAAARADAPSDTEQASQATENAQADAEQSPHEPEDRDNSGARADQRGAGHLGQHTDPAAPAPLPGQQSLFDGPVKDAPRPAQVTKASGENPFLPQHIRARLRGNQPLPKGEFKHPSTPPAHLEPLPTGPAADSFEPQPPAGAEHKREHSQADGASQELNAGAITPAPKAPETQPLSPATAALPADEAEPKSTAMPSALTDAEIHAMVDALVAEQLPKLEQQLRAQLLAKLRQQDPEEH